MPDALTPLYLGIDGGGTVLRVVLADAELTVYGRAEGPGANPSLVGRERAAAIVRETVLAALGPLPADSIAAVAIGLAGAAASHSRTWLLEVLHAVLPGARVIPSADYEIALVGALGRRQGVIVLAGTGALAYGVNAQGEHALAGGWGYLLGDEGGGYWLGSEGLRAMLRAADGRGPATALSQVLLSALSLRAPEDVIPWLYHDMEAPARTAAIAALAPLVLQAADAGDSSALAIVDEAATELVCAVQTVRCRLRAPDLPLAFAGGLLTAPNPLCIALCQRLGLAAPPVPLYPPVMGAVLLAREADVARQTREGDANAHR